MTLPWRYLVSVEPDAKEQDFRQAKIDRMAEQKEIGWLQRILMVNVGLDVVYILIGTLDAETVYRVARSPGIGLGYSCPGALAISFLMVFD
ncbi:hypothetical protein KDW_01650 [Dictyobacter vulcani]|uniref:Uncharacterized protein n=1 Tax=Dictyobacter vulcani TaxID=2607529 RepID=A0A5J4KEP2_9CHLR|nr:hypothetical protein KDW_01650 [Dictyobacter vulcani]